MSFKPGVLRNIILNQRLRPSMINCGFNNQRYLQSPTQQIQNYYLGLHTGTTPQTVETSTDLEGLQKLEQEIQTKIDSIETQNELQKVNDDFQKYVEEECQQYQKLINDDAKDMAPKFINED